MRNINIREIVYTIISYNRLDEWLEKLILEMSEHPKDRFFKPSRELIANERTQVIWEILIQLFGDWGINVSSGWIEDVEECLEFLKSIDQEVKNEF